jgi:septal ring factor EnvC (AmiA/AmiB activator)
LSPPEEPKNNRGGYRPGSGNKYKWRHGETKPVRIPIAIADEVVELAKAIDSGKRLVPDDNVTQSANTRGSDEEVDKCQAEIENLKALSRKLSDKVGGLEADLIKTCQQLKQVTNERDDYLDRISDIDLELQNLKDDRVTQSTLDDSVTQSIRPNLDPAAILNRLRRERKTKADLKDVELILELIQALVI